MIVRRTILKQDLVKKLYPDSISIKSAMQQLRNEIDICPTLKLKIEKAGNLKRHYYTKQQLLIILEHFCITLEEFELL
ncbi:DUF4248 domain-containing protein [Plebeiibacterium sediminum]|uniref:DUF4248 domain-containing protein n=1 Tax=Plebeiibacterium sediminum TaxID=2992112 RepID=A0AAE3M7F3_9BACT|nr:DUF4248 domain-containing protein [Plebeiobacterium sediminum]MCW3788498.1 DUF4248 domain-containing protein [Plebeiobacterium sediminum]